VGASCEELGNAFLNPHDLIASLSTDAAAMCPACGTRSLQEFIAASSTQIRKAGLDGLFE
jgi:hypothetical protein